MGNKESNESAAVKRQAEGGANPMYDLLDLKGGGYLFFIMKRAMVKKDYKEIDEAIKSKVTPYLYNGGEGKMVPVIQLAMLRNRDRPPRKQFPQIKELGEAGFNYVFEGSDLLASMTEGLDPATSPDKFREACWMVEKRGSVGETTFHVCFLMQTPTHLALGRRLLKWYPKLLNDVYLSEEYYGENVLHMSVVAEDPTTVKFLLDQGINIHERCYGNFFCPEDQKASRNDSIEHEIVDVQPRTNYQGYVAWGEYPLSFAAVLSQEECYRLILNRGANHDLVDTNGNSVTHIMVVYDNMRMFDIAVECGASINIKNNLNMTPLAVAAYLARQEMFFHIANIEREVYWQIGNVCCSAYPIEQLDSIDGNTGELNMQSALNLIVFGHLVQHLDLIEGIVVDLLQTKWKSFIRKVFFRQLYAFTLFFWLSSFCFVARPAMPKYNATVDAMEAAEACLNASFNVNMSELISLDLTNIPTMTEEEEPGDQDELFTTEIDMNSTDVNGSLILTSSSAPPSPTTPPPPKMPSECLPKGEDLCIFHTYDTNLKLLRGLAEALLVVGSIIYLVRAAMEIPHLGLKLWWRTLALCPSRIMFLTGCALTILAVPFRLGCRPKTEDKLALLVMLMTGPYFLFFCRGFKKTGPFVIMIYRMMAADLIRFATIYSIFVMGFSQAYYMIYQSYKPLAGSPMPSPFESIIQAFVMSLGSFGHVWGGVDSTDHPFVGKIHSFLFLAIAHVLLVNLLIAMMGDTYNKIAEIKNEWMRQWARTVLIVERGIPPAERLKQQNLYSERMATKEKALVMKQTMTEEKLEEIKDILEMKVTHRRNIKKRKAKFGYESNSLIGLDLGSASVIAPDAVMEEDDMDVPPPNGTAMPGAAGGQELQQ